jgi:ribose 5-phosphate isomerase B
MKVMKKVVPIGCDHAGFELKEKVVAHLTAKGYEVKDFGTHSTESIDYPDYGHPVAEMVESNAGMLGVVICGSGNGINMTVNKHQGIRSALCWTKEIAAHWRVSIMMLTFLRCPRALLVFRGWFRHG